MLRELLGFITFPLAVLADEVFLVTCADAYPDEPYLDDEDSIDDLDSEDED